MPDAETRDAGTAVTALIVDLSASRQLAAGRRQALQHRLEEVMEELNRELAPAVLARFTVTLGDEFQGLLSRPQVLPSVLWRLRVDLPDHRFWTGVGHGALETELKPEAVGMDGEAFHRARGAVETAKTDGRRGGVFDGFGEDTSTLNGLARLLGVQRDGFTEAQVEAVQLIRTGHSQREAAERLDVTPQAVHNRLRAAAWEAFREGEEALAGLLERYDTSAGWRGR